jgi:hypothetical protein
MASLDEVEDKVSDEVLVTLDDQIHGLEGKYVGKSEVKGSEGDEPLYKIYFKPPTTTISSIPQAVLSKIKRSDQGEIKEYPDKIPESGLQESVNTSSEISDPAQPDKKTVLRHAKDESAPYSDNKGDKEDDLVSTLRKQKQNYKTKWEDAKAKLKEAEIENDVEDDTGPAYRRDEIRREGEVM